MTAKSNAAPTMASPHHTVVIPSSAAKQSLLGAAASTILSSYNGSAFIYFLLIWQTTTLIAVYTIAVLDGHVPPLPHIPMISDCGCYYPEANVFQIGFIVTAALMGMGSVMFQSVVKLGIQKLEQGGADPKTLPHSLNNVLLILSLISSTGLAVLSSVNECEDNSVHSAFAGIFFIFYLIYQIFVCVMLRNTAKLVPTYSIVLKEIITGITFLALLTLGVCGNLDWSKYSQQIAASEWTAVIMIMLFNATFIHELKQGIKIAVVSSAPPQN